MANFNVSQVETLNAQDFVSATLNTPITPYTFRLQFPAFANSQTYPDAQIAFYLNVASMMRDSVRWEGLADYALALITAHFVALDRQAAANPRGIPGTAIGVLTSASASKVSWGKDVASVMEPDAGHWGMTTYGMIFLRLARQIGMGPIQVGIDSGAGYLTQSANAFAGFPP